MKSLIILVMLLSGCSPEKLIEIHINTPQIKTGWFASEYEVLEHDITDVYNGLYNGCWVRPINITERNKYGYGYINVYGEYTGVYFANVQFKNHFISFKPSELEKVKIQKIPLWAINRSGYYWDDAKTTENMEVI